ncbi:aminopeptidase [Mycoplasma anatis]|uniref:aminopeptidase C n=1 Tax=Mycoplasmopsis anatis TaxID=171279 RepID=UPI001C4E203B|nr:C1 family peptidase [Mycoplasmopsis anatis]MBW0595999.1 aminopeptidase [Mycoplasmopsis anatis]MBW0596582.1 aminopeptidase [Mycoplasmopsis anatis]MBW0597484.1 aminopeptidase [Mycoplasmopsis anatis]MBW0599729.1 aminopeptidase [Mycoplasmopsis anatis]MBW0600357.1 aminopeptidase [Mycoplasmopsis anatis]
MEITQELLKQFKNKYNKNKNSKIIENTIVKNGIDASSINHETIKKHNFVFNVETTKGEITNQKNSGRCWIFASLNMARVIVMKKLNVANIELSQNYLAFYDKLEKANTFLHNIELTKHLEVSNHLVQQFLTSPCPDGGYWEYFQSLVLKYGVVPKEVMPETFQSERTYELNDQISLRLRKYAKLIRESSSKSEIDKLKETCLSEIYDILCKSLGVPPQKFSFEYKDKDNKYEKISNISPVEFFEKFIGKEFIDKVDIIHDPRDIYKHGSAFVLKYAYSVLNKNEVKMINVPLQELKNATIKSLEDGNPVWFGCDVGKYSNSKLGIMDTELFNYNDIFSDTSDFTKADRLQYRESGLSHAMSFVGVNIDKKHKVTNWMVENSWGSDSGKKGIFSMSDKWFDEFNYSVIVDKKYVDEKYLKTAESEIVEIEPWDVLCKFN